MPYRLYTEEKVLYYADSNLNGLHVSVNEKAGTTLKGLVQSLVGKKMIYDPLADDGNGGDRYYLTTLLGKVYLKILQLEYALSTSKNYDALYQEIGNIAEDAIGKDELADVIGLLVLARDGQLDAKSHKGELAMRIINRMGLLQSGHLNAKGKILLRAVKEGE
jgi:hypothetical protein